MNKYKVGDKIVLTVSDVNEKAYYSYYVFNNNDLILWEPSTDNYAEPLSTYTEPLEAKIKRQAAEITRLLAENKELKNEKQELTRERNQLMGRCGGLSAAKIKAFNNGRLAGQNEAWELAQKIFKSDIYGGFSSTEIGEIFGYDFLTDIITKHTYPEAAAKVEAWGKAKEKPQKTILMDLLEKLPNIETEVDGLPKFCPFALGYDVLCSSKKNL